MIEFHDGQFIERYQQMVDGRWEQMVSTDDEPATTDGDPWAEEALRDLGDLCGCVDVTPLLEPLAHYLRGVHGRYGDDIIQFDSTDPLQLLIACLASDAHFTEHGGNIGGSWPTPAGRRWLELVEQEQT